MGNLPPLGWDIFSRTFAQMQKQTEHKFQIKSASNFKIQILLIQIIYNNNNTNNIIIPNTNIISNTPTLPIYFVIWKFPVNPIFTYFFHITHHFFGYEIKKIGIFYFFLTNENFAAHIVKYFRPFFALFCTLSHWGKFLHFHILGSCRFFLKCGRFGAVAMSRES